MTACELILSSLHNDNLYTVTIISLLRRPRRQSSHTTDWNPTPSESYHVSVPDWSRSIYSLKPSVWHWFICTLSRIPCSHGAADIPAMIESLRCLIFRNCLTFSIPRMLRIQVYTVLALMTEKCLAGGARGQVYRGTCLSEIETEVEDVIKSLGSDF